MSRERILQIGVVAALLIAGMLVGWYFSAAPEETVPTAASRIFREWFWEHRSLDLLVQVMLIFVGALGVAAVLPRRNESSPTIYPNEGSETFLWVEKDGGNHDLALD